MSHPTLARGEATVQTIQKLDLISDRLHDLYASAVSLHHESRTSLIAAERENAGIALKALNETIKTQMLEHREVLKKLAVTDVAEVYVVEGCSRDEAIVEAKESLAGLETRITKIEERAGRMVADLVYGL